jgi:hypothetical protein
VVALAEQILTPVEVCAGSLHIAYGLGGGKDGERASRTGKKRFFSSL